MSTRIETEIARPDTVTIEVDGRPLSAHPGESLAVALLAAGIRALRASPRAGGARGAFCFMGACQECVVTVDGRRVTSCLEPVRAGMRVRLGLG
ncbi:MAG: (2Fe-2S)-binding protein [Ectothiorhodospiraceae bacterium]|nr:(2Fe-2S)-binding protein [Ectothiorhodospiraceae bacterium]